MKKPIAAFLLCFLIVLSTYISPLSASSVTKSSAVSGTSSTVTSSASSASSTAASGTSSAPSSKASGTSSTVGSSGKSSTATSASSSKTSSSASSEIASEDAQTISDLTNTYADLQKKIDDLQKEKDKLASEQKDVTKYLSTLNDQIDATNDQLNILNDQIDNLNGQLDKLTTRISQVESDISTTLETFKQRLRGIYMAGHGSELEWLLSSDSFVDFLTRAEIMRRISEHDQNIVNQLIADKTELEGLVVEAQNARQDSQNKKVDISSKKKELNAQYDEQDQYLTKLKENKAAYDAYIKKYQDEMADAQKEIDAIMAKYQDDGAYVGGDFAWPLPGFTKITSPYGARPSRGDFHTGTDIAGRNAAGDICAGYPVVAANAGTVIAVRNLGSKSYGQYIIIDHGGGCKTLYAHLSKIEVKEGQTVKRGQEIGKAGSTGNTTGPHLHFELWLNNTRVDPMDHLTIPK